jgi:hypothetical protein
MHQMQHEIHQMELYLLLYSSSVSLSSSSSSSLVSTSSLYFYSHEALLLIIGDTVGHLLSIGTIQVALVLRSVVGSADSLCHDASVKAIYPTLVAGEDVLRVVQMILVQVGW